MKRKIKKKCRPNEHGKIQNKNRRMKKIKNKQEVKEESRKLGFRK